MMQKVLLGLFLATLPAFPAQSQNVCFITNSRGETTDLEYICGANAQNKQSPSSEQQFVREYVRWAANMPSRNTLLDTVNRRPDLSIDLGKKVCGILRSGGTPEDVANIWAKVMIGADASTKVALTDDASIIMNIAPKYFCPEYVGKF